MKTGDEMTVLVVGPGPVTLHQGAGFQYLAARICRCLRRRGFRVVVLEDNPATLMDGVDGEVELFMEPPVPPVVASVAEECGITSLWLGPAGQRGWSLARGLAAEGWLERVGLRLADIPDRVFWACGDRSLLREILEEGGLANPAFRVAANLREAQEAAAAIGFPLVVRPHFSSGGLGTGVAFNREELFASLTEASRRSPGGEVLLEEYLGGWRKYVACVLRDGRGAARVAGMMEQLEPLPVHEEDAPVVVPPLAGGELRYALEEIAKKTVELVGVVGLAEVKLAVSPGCERIYVIDIDAGPRRATPLLEIALGMDLVSRHVDLVCGGGLEAGDQDRNPKGVVLALPRFYYPVMGREEGHLPLECHSVGRTLLRARDFGEAFRAARRLADEEGTGLLETTWEALERAARRAIAIHGPEGGVSPSGEQTAPRSGAEGEAGYPLWLAGSAEGLDEGGVMFMGATEARPGGGHEHHFNLWRAIRAWRSRGGRAAAYVSDHGFALFLIEEADAVFLGPPCKRGVEEALARAGTWRICLHFGGGDSLALARKMERGSRVAEPLGGWIDGQEAPRLMMEMRTSGLPTVSFTSRRAEVADFLRSTRFPVHLALLDDTGVVMDRVCYGAEEVEECLTAHPEARPLVRELGDDPIEVLVEAVALKGRLCLCLAWERLQAPGGDAGEGLAVFPPLHLTSQQHEKLMRLVERAVGITGWTGNLSLRMTVMEGEIRLWDLSLGASEHLPFLARASSLPLPELGLGALLGEGEPLETREVGCSAVRYHESPLGVIAGEDLLLHSRRLHTGEVMGRGEDLGQALAKLLWSLGMHARPGGRALLSVANREKRRAVLLARELNEAGYALVATRGTAKALRAAGMEVEEVNKLREGRPNVLDLLRNGEIQLVVNVPRGRHPRSDGFYIREEAARQGIPCLTDMEAAMALVRGMRISGEGDCPVRPLGSQASGVTVVRGG